MNDTHSLSHTKWNCKYHVVFAPKYRRKVFYEDKLVLGYKCGHKNVESVKLKARKDVSNIEQAVYRRIQNDGG